jgi:hypothetical protein
MNPRLHEVEPIIEFIANREVVQAGGNRMFAISELNLRLEDFVFALRTTARAAEQLKLAFDILRVCGPDCPMQRNDATFALRQPLECGVPLRVILNPPSALGDEHDNPVRLIDERRAFRPRLIGFHHGNLEPLNRSEQFLQHAHPGDILVSARRMAIRPLANQKQTPALWRVSESGRRETNHDQQGENKNRT